MMRGARIVLCNVESCSGALGWVASEVDTRNEPAKKWLQDGNWQSGFDYEKLGKALTRVSFTEDMMLLISCEISPCLFELLLLFPLLEPELFICFWLFELLGFILLLSSFSTWRFGSTIYSVKGRILSIKGNYPSFDPYAAVPVEILTIPCWNYEYWAALSYIKLIQLLIPIRPFDIHKRVKLEIHVLNCMFLNLKKVFSREFYRS